MSAEIEVQYFLHKNFLLTAENGGKEFVRRYTMIKWIVIVSGVFAVQISAAFLQ